MPFVDLGALRVAVIADNADANKKIQETGDLVKKTADSSAVNWGKVGGTLNKVGGDITKYFTLPIAAASTAAVKLASDLSETMNKVDVTFGNSAGAVAQWADGSIQRMGLATQTALDMAAGFGDMGSSMGIANAQNKDMSTSLVQLAADMASFKNISIDRANTALNGVYTGETEALKSLGIVMTEANLEQYAINQGIKTQYSNMTQAEKVMLRYRYVMQSTSNAQGDFARTGGGLANQTRMMSENAKELGTSFGDILSPAANNIIQKVNGILQGFQALSPEQKQFILTIGLTVAAVGPLLSVAGSLITTVQGLSVAMAALNLSTGGVIAILALAAVAIGGLVASFLTGGNKADETAVKFNTLGSILDDTKGKTDELGKSVEGLPDSKNTDITADTSSAKSDIKSLGDEIDKTKAKLDPSILFKIDTVDATNNLNSFNTAWSTLMNGSGKFRTELKDLKDVLASQTEDMQNYYNSLAATQLLYLVGLRQAGVITKEEYSAAFSEVVTIQQEQIEKTEAQKKANEELLSTLKGGKDIVAAGETYYDLATQGADATSVAMLNAADSAKLFQQAVDGGYAGTVAGSEAAGNWATAVGIEVTDAAEKAAMATDKYNTAVDNANSNAEAQKIAIDAMIISQQNQEAALQTLYTAVQNGVPVFDALKTAEQTYGVDSVAAVKAACDEKGGLIDMSFADYLALAKKYGDDISELQTEQNSGYKSVEEQHQQALLDAQNKLAADLSAITFSFTSDEIANWKKMFEDQGYILDEGTSQSLDTMMQFLSDVENGVITDGATIQSTWETIWNSLPQYVKDSMSQSKNDASEGGKEVGSALGTGTETGLESAQGKIVSQAKRNIQAAIKAMKQAAEIASPSKVVKREVGKELAAAVPAGFEEELPASVRKIQASMGKIVTGGVSTAQRSIIDKSNSVAYRGPAKVEQNISYVTRPMTPYETQLQNRRLSKDLLKGVT